MFRKILFQILGDINIAIKIVCTCVSLILQLFRSESGERRTAASIPLPYLSVDWQVLLKHSGT